MKVAITFIWLTLYVLSAKALSADLFPQQSLQLKYRVSSQTSIGNISGKADLTWSREGDQYRATMEIKALFLTLLSSQSEGAVQSKIRPARYTQKLLRQKEAGIVFDESGNLLLRPQKKTSRPLRAGEQDTLSLIWQARAAVVANSSESQWSLPMADPSDDFNVTLRNLGLTSTPMGAAWHLQHLPSETASTAAEKKQFDFWFAPDKNYLPVKIRFTEPNKEYIELTLVAP